MRKIALFVMTLMMAGSLFAYEPNKENVTVKRNGDVVYYEQTEVYNIYGWNPARSTANKKLNQDYVKWVVRKGYTVENLVNYEYKILERLRPHINDFGRLIQAEGELAEYEKRTAIISIPFVTEENYLTLTKEEMLVKMFAFISDCTNYIIGDNKMIADLILTMALEMFPIQLPMTKAAYDDLQTIEVANRQNAVEWFYRNKEENKWLDVNDLITDDR